MARYIDQPSRFGLTVIVALAAWWAGLLITDALLIALTDYPLGLNTATDTVPAETFLVLLFRILLAFAIAAAITLPVGRALVRSTR